MWPFRKILTREQAQLLSEAAEALNGQRAELEEALLSLRHGVEALYSDCVQATQMDTDVDVSTERLEDARSALTAYGTKLLDAQETLYRYAPSEWHPRHFRKRYYEWDDRLTIQMKFLLTATKALEHPTLRNEPGNRRPNMFASGLNMVATARDLPRFKER